MWQPRISVVICTMNRPAYLREAVKSIQRQTLKDLEIVIVQDGRDEATRHAILELQRADDRIQYAHQPVKGNIARATNLGVRAAIAPYIAILDDDDLWTDEAKLEKQLAYLEAHPGVVGCSGGIVATDETGCEVMRYLKPEHDADIKRRALMANPMVHTTCMYRRDAAFMIGLYEETLDGFADWDFWLKLGCVGEFYNFQQYFGSYRVWRDGATYRTMRVSTRCALRIVWRHRHNYGYFVPALAMVVMHNLYAMLPLAARKATYEFLAQIKRRAFAQRAA